MSTKIDCTDTVAEYVFGNDWRIKANSNTTYSNAGLVNNTAGKVIANYWLDKVYSYEEGEAHRSGDYHIHDLDCLTGYCFSGDTKVVLLDGTTPTFKELVDKYGDGTPFWVVSRDKNNNIVPGRAHHPRITRSNADLVEVTISGGAVIHCTPDHEFMLRDGSYKKAIDLKKRDSLMPYYYSVKDNYLYVNDSKLNINNYLHRVIGAYINKCDINSNFIVHHINGNKKDNRPDNLVIMEDSEHRRFELSNIRKTDNWKKANRSRLIEYNKSEDKRRAVSLSSRKRTRDSLGRFYNHTVANVKKLSYREDVYCLTVDEYENFALEAGIFVHNCAGWNLRTLLNEGFNGVRSRVNSRPPKHFISALGQMVNFLGILQSEWAGAQAFSSFDTFLAPYVFKDKLTFEQVKSAISGFVYGLNVPSRWGQCIPSTYKCLKGDGTWVTYDSLKVGDEIYVIDTETGDLKKDIVTHINLFDAPGTMHRYKNKHGFSFDVTDKHRVIYRTGSNNYSIRRSEELINRCNSVFIPISPWGSYKAEDCNIPDNILEFVTFILCDGCIVTQRDKSPRLEFYKSPKRYGVERFENLCEQLNIQYSKVTVNSSEFNNSICYKYRLKTCEAVNSVLELLGYDKHKQPSFIKDLSSRQANLMLDTWVKLDGFSDSMHSRLQADTKSIHEMLAYLAIIAGRSVELGKRLVTSNNKTKTSYAYLYKRKCRSCSIEEVNSVCNQVWCPTTNTGTFVCMSDTGCIFLTGNSPFTNVTIDWTVPDDLKNVSPLSGGEHLLKGIKDWDLLDKAVKRGCSNLEDLTYKHFQTEMNIIQKAYYEVMTEGDSTGQPFTFPIPTVNITEDFDWNGENVLTLFENTAKIGSSYFQNFVGSQYKLDENGNKIPDDDAYKPGAVRSMCPMPYDTLVLVSESLNNKAPIVMPIGDLYKYHNNDSLECYYRGKWDKCHVIKTEMKQKVYELHTADGCSYKFGAEHLQPVYTGEIESTVPVKLIRPGYYIPFSKGVIDTKCRKGGYILGLVAGALVGSGYIDGNTYVFCHIRKSIYKRLLKAFNSYHIISSEYNRDGTFTLKVKGNELTQLLPVILDNIVLTERVVSSSLYCRIGVALALIHTRGYTQEGKTFIRLYDNKTAENANRLFKSLGFLTDYHVVSDTCIEIEYCKSYKSSNDSRAKLINGTWYKEVVDIDTYTPTDDLYCFEVDNSDHLFMLPDGLITHNCRLQLDLNELRKRGNGLFGSAESTGSIGVVTINLARLGYVHAGDKEGLYKSLDKLMDKAKSTLEKKRKVVSELFDAGLYPYTKRYLPAGFINHFSTIGVNGGNEMIRNFTHDKENICTSWGKEFAEELLEHMRSKLREYQHETGNLYNLEASPGEGACYRFAREDKKRFPDIIQAGHEGHNYYTNSTQIPVNFTEDLFAALKLQDDLQTRYSGGTVFHMYMSEMVSSTEACRDMVRKVLTVFRMPYITVTPLFSVCDKHGYLRGRHEYCPICDEEIIQHERSCCK